MFFIGVDLGDIVAKKPVSFEELAGKMVAIDGNNALYQFLAIIRQRDGSPLTDRRGRITSHLSGLFYRTARLFETGIRPIYVFDGVPPEMKQRTIEERRELRAAASDKWAQALKEGDFQGVRAFSQASSRLTKPMIEDAKRLLGAMGVPVVQAPQEGEAQAAFMAAKGDVYAAASQDYDSLLLGTPLLVRNLTVSGKRKLPRREEFVDVVPEIISLEDSLSALGLSREKLIWLAILCGTDFNKGVKGVGPKKALKIVRESSSLAGATAKSGGEFEIDPQEVLDYFLRPKVEEIYSLSFHIPTKEALVRFLVDEFDFSETRVEASADKLISSLGEKQHQKNLSEFFG